MNFRVTRFGPARNERREYGPFEDRRMAEHVSRAAAEKHVGCSVVVEPIHSTPPRLVAIEAPVAPAPVMPLLGRRPARVANQETSR